MKAIFPLVSFASIVALFTQSASAVDFVRQIQLINGQTVVYDTPIAWKSGDLRSQPLKGDGAIFQLYAYDDDSLSPFTLVDANAGQALHANVALASQLLDVDALGLHLDVILGDTTGTSALPKLLAEKAVGTYIPEAQITLISKDSYFPPRIRADQSYDVRISIGKLPEPNAEIPAGAPTKVFMDHGYKLYHPTLHVPASNGSGQGSYSDSLELKLNGTFTIPSQYQQLPGQYPTQVSGEETYSASVKVGTNTAKIASATIQIWPVGKATIEGIPANKKFSNVPENLQSTMTDLYPDSITYARIYAGTENLGASGQTIPSSVISYNTYAPQNAVVPISGLDDFIDKDGIYTIEVVTITPFNDHKPERLAYTSFEINRTIEVRAALTTANDQ